MPIRYFAWCNSLLDTLMYQSEGITKMVDTILRDNPELVLNCGRPKMICKRVGTDCLPSCKVFDPRLDCKYSTIDGSYNTLAKALWLFRSSRFAEQQHWETFYSCFHPKPRDKDKDKRFVKKFPNDIALISVADARSNFQIGQQYKAAESAAKWTSERLAAVSGTDLEHRMASTDWDWHWYSGCLRKKLTVSLAHAEAKVQLDRLLYDIYGDDYESTGTYTIDRTNSLYTRIEGLYRQVKHLMDAKLEFVTSR